MQEAKEVSEGNDWFTYAEPLHRLREFGKPNPITNHKNDLLPNPTQPESELSNQNLGVPVKEYYTVDYKKFNHDQMKAMCCLIFGQQSSEIPHPINEWKHFLFKIGNITPYFFQSITCPVNTTILTLTLSTHILYFN